MRRLYKHLNFAMALAIAGALGIFALPAHSQQNASGNTNVVISNTGGNATTGGGVYGAAGSSYKVKDPTVAQGNSASAAVGAVTEKTGANSAQAAANTTTSTLANGNGAHNNVALDTNGLQWNQANTGTGANFAGGANESTATGTATDKAKNSLTATQNSTENGTSSGAIYGAGTNNVHGQAQTTGTSTITTIIVPTSTAPKVSSSVAGDGGMAGQVVAGNTAGNTFAVAGAQGEGSYKASTPALTATGSLNSKGTFNSKIGTGTASASASQSTTAQAH